MPKGLPAREDAAVIVPAPGELVEKLRGLPAARPLMSRLAGAAGVYLVGGAVRDLLLGGRPSDLDLVVEGDAARFARSLGGEARVHDRFGTSTITLDGRSYDVARARRERYAHPGALPDVEPASLAEDLQRRDFTVNAIAMALGGPRPGELSSAQGALEDLDARRLRVLHDTSFIDDPTRILRMVRYASRLGFAIDPHTRALLGGALAGQALQTVSGSRLGAELRLLAREPDPVRALECLHELGVDVALHPALARSRPAVARRALELLAPDHRRDRLAIAAAALGVPVGELRALLDALAFPAEDRDVIIQAATRAPELARELEAAAKPSQIAQSATSAVPELVALAGALGPAKQAHAWLTRLRHVRPSISGEDLLAAGVPAGPAIGRGLRAALAAKLDGTASGREGELEAALRAATQTG